MKKSDFARLCEVSRAAITKAVKARRVIPDKDGSINPDFPANRFFREQLEKKRFEENLPTLEEIRNKDKTTYKAIKIGYETLEGVFVPVSASFYDKEKGGDGFDIYYAHSEDLKLITTEMCDPVQWIFPDGTTRDAVVIDEKEVLSNE